MKILIAGASGLVGSELKKVIAESEHQFAVLKRENTDSSHSSTAAVNSEDGETSFAWNPEKGKLPAEAIQWADAVISLSGASLAKLPWTKKYKQQIVNSRVWSTKTIAKAIAKSAQPPQTWISGSAVGFYGSRPGEKLTETSSSGTGFLANTVRQWEATTSKADSSTRVVHARTGLVLAKEGALKPLMLLAKFRVAGKVGEGSQIWPWISLTDEAKALLHLATVSKLKGSVNLVAPENNSSVEVTEELASQLQKPHWLPAPSPLLKLVMGEAAEELLLADQQVSSELLLVDGFEFQYPNLSAAVSAAVN